MEASDAAQVATPKPSRKSATTPVDAGQARVDMGSQGTA